MTERERAIKEFAERLTARLIEKGLYPVIIRNLIRDIAKEMGTE